MRPFWATNDFCQWDKKFNHITPSYKCIHRFVGRGEERSQDSHEECSYAFCKRLSIMGNHCHVYKDLGDTLLLRVWCQEKCGLWCLTAVLPCIIQHELWDRLFLFWLRLPGNLEQNYPQRMRTVTLSNHMTLFLYPQYQEFYHVCNSL